MNPIKCSQTCEQHHGCCLDCKYPLKMLTHVVNFTTANFTKKDVSNYTTMLICYIPPPLIYFFFMIYIIVHMYGHDALFTCGECCYYDDPLRNLIYN